MTKRHDNLFVYDDDDDDDYYYVYQTIKMQDLSCFLDDAKEIM